MFECVWDMDSKNGYFKNLTCPMTFLDDLVFLEYCRPEATNPPAIRLPTHPCGAHDDRDNETLGTRAALKMDAPKREDKKCPTKTNK